MAHISVTKHHGLGNDFLVLLCLDEDTVTPSLETGARLARELCDRHRGIGADGLLLASLPSARVGRRVHPDRPVFNDQGILSDREGDGEASGIVDAHADVDVVMRLHNADGSVAEMSGNGIRCFAQAIVDSGFCGPGILRVLTGGGLRVVGVDASDPTGLAMVRVDMGVAKVDSFEVPTAVSKIVGTRRVTTVDVGNPHIVIEGDPGSIDISVFGPAVEAHFVEQFGGINVEVVSAADDANVTMVVWERGVGITQACGTGATATAIATHRWGLTGPATAVHQPGGTSVVELRGEEITLIGPSQFVAACTAYVDDDLWPPRHEVAAKRGEQP